MIAVEGNNGKLESVLRFQVELWPVVETLLTRDSDGYYSNPETQSALLVQELASVANDKGWFHLVEGVDDEVVAAAVLEVADRALTEFAPAQPSQGPDWPAAPDAKVFRGLAGDFVNLVSPHSEADPAALLVQFLVVFGCIIGRSVYRVVDGARHYTNLFAILIGPTSHGRKGSAWAWVKKLFVLVDEVWARAIGGGLSSGEGLIWCVRDPIEEIDSKGETVVK
ncbi:MAG: hypothetical protein ACLQU2_36270, partial [Candidatus Binataceae bacterium]